MPTGSSSVQGQTTTPLVLVIDLGSGGPKVGVATMRGALLWHDMRSVVTTHLDDGGAVQDPGEWWQAVVDMTRAAMASGCVESSAIAAVSVTGQYASTVPVDAAGKPVGDCMMWMDTRGAPYARARFGGRASGYGLRTLAAWVRRSGGAPSLSGADPIGHRLYMQNARPGVVAAARWMLEPIDALTMRFTGVAHATPASMATAWLIDTRTPSGHPVYDDELVERSGVQRAQLPPLIAGGSVVGTVLRDVAETLGLPPDVAVVSALPDLHTAALGAGATGIHQGHLAISTSSWVSSPVTAKKTDVFHQIATVPGLTDDHYLIINNHEVGGLALAWLRDGPLCSDDGVMSFDALTGLAAAAKPGSGGVIFTPWLNGERSPVDDHHARGGFHNLSLDTGRADMVRAVLEGVAFNSRWLNEAVEKFAGTTFDPLRIIGGGAVSELWCQIHADVLNRTIQVPADPMHANLRGAALHAAIVLGHIAFNDVPDVVPLARTHHPTVGNRGVYDRLYQEFPRLYRAQSGMFRRLNATPES